MNRYISLVVFLGFFLNACESQKLSPRPSSASSSNNVPDAAKKPETADSTSSNVLFQLLSDLQKADPKDREKILGMIAKLDLSTLAPVAKESPLSGFFTKDGGERLANHLEKIDPAKFQVTLGDLIDQAREVLVKIGNVVADILDNKVIFGDCGRLVMENDANECSALRKLGDDMKEACTDAGGTPKETPCDLNNQPMPAGCHGREFTTCQGANGPEQMRMAFIECIFTPPADPKEKRKDYCKNFNQKALEANDANP